MKVLSITPFLQGAPIHPSFGGKSSVSLKITTALVEEGHEVFVLPWSYEKIWDQTRFRIANGSSYATALPTTYMPSILGLVKKIIKSFNNKEALKNPKDHIRRQIKHSFYNREIALKKAVNTVKPDIVHVHHTNSKSIDFYRKHNFNIPIILTHHSYGLTDKAPLYDYVIFVSKNQHQNAIKRYPALKSKSKTINNCISQEYYKEATPKNSNKVLFLSRFKKEKGLQVLLDAFSTGNEMDELELRVIGTGDLMPDYKQFINEKSLSNVKLLGRLSKDQNAIEMEEANLFVVPSLLEGFALIYIEALCMGLPIIGFPPNVREHNKLLGMQVGYEFDAHNESPQKLADLIKQAMDSKLTSIPYRKELMKRARQEFSYEHFKKEYLEIYEKLVSNSSKLPTSLNH